MDYFIVRLVSCFNSSYLYNFFKKITMKIERNLMKNLLHTYYTLEKFLFKLLNNNSFFEVYY